MLEDGYQADGWLGMLIGTHAMWHGFYGTVLTDESLFELKVSELCQDIGERGRGSAVGAVVAAGLYHQHQRVSSQGLLHGGTPAAEAKAEHAAEEAQLRCRKMPSEYI